MDTEDLSFHIPAKMIRDKIRKSWGAVKPATKVAPLRKEKRVKDNVRKQINEALDDED